MSIELQASTRVMSPRSVIAGSPNRFVLSPSMTYTVCTVDFSPLVSVAWNWPTVLSCVEVGPYNAFDAGKSLTPMLRLANVC